MTKDTSDVIRQYEDQDSNDLLTAWSAASFYWIGWMKLLVAILGSRLLLAVAAFCGFGFLATFEPTDNVAQLMAFRIGYGLIGLGCLVGVGFLIMNAVRK